MSRKASSDSHHGLNDVIGFALLAVAVLLLVSQWSFDRYDLSFVSTSNAPHHQTHNWIGLVGADMAYAFFFIFGLAAYLIPFLLAAFGVGYLTHFLSHLRERRLWLSLWSVVLMFSLSGLLDMMNGPLKSLRENVCAPGAGGLFGQTLFDFKLFGYDWGFWVLGSIGATIVYLALCFISLLFLTNFRLGDWIRRLFAGEKSAGIGPEANRGGGAGPPRPRTREAGEAIAGASRPLRPRRGYAARARTDRARFVRAAIQRPALPQNHSARTAQGSRTRCRRRGNQGRSARSSRRHHRRNSRQSGTGFQPETGQSEHGKICRGQSRNARGRTGKSRD